MTDPSNDWCTIESDPGVFTELLEALGCHAVELQELYTLDDMDIISSDQTIYGLIFLFPWKSKEERVAIASSNAASTSPTEQSPPPEDLFFAHQVTTNACATQALLSVVLNTVTDLGSTLTEFKTFTASFPPPLKGMAIAGSEIIQQAHNSFARADAFWQDPTQPRAPRTGSKEEVYHFVAYIPFRGTVYELDGLQSEPVFVGTYNHEDETTNTSWLAVAREALQSRMAEQQGQFNLMAVIPNQLQKVQQQLQQEGNCSDTETLQLQQQLQHEMNKRQLWKLENERRRHNYVPFCVQLLKEMARQGTLEQCVQQARERRAAKKAKQSQD
jgi:ubiquitin carboxyl-terminal hydrolase L5